MKKNVLKLFGAAALFAVAMLVNASINDGSQDVNLADLAQASDANAECYNKPYTNNGNCSTLSGNCYAQKSPQDCDSTANW